MLFAMLGIYCDYGNFRIEPIGKKKENEYEKKYMDTRKPWHLSLLIN